MDSVNFVVYSRKALGATFAAAALVGHSVQAQTSRNDHERCSPPYSVDDSFLDASPVQVAVLDKRYASERSQDLGQSVDAALSSLAASQQRLDPDVLQFMTEQAWDLYDES